MSERMSIAEAAEYLQASQQTVRRLITREVLKRVELGRRVYVLREQVEKLDKEGTCNSTSAEPGKKRSALVDTWRSLTGRGRKKAVRSSK